MSKLTPTNPIKIQLPSVECSLVPNPNVEEFQLRNSDVFSTQRERAYQKFSQQSFFASNNIFRAKPDQYSMSPDYGSSKETSISSEQRLESSGSSEVQKASVAQANQHDHKDFEKDFLNQIVDGLEVLKLGKGKAYRQSDVFELLSSYDFLSNFDHIETNTEFVFKGILTKDMIRWMRLMPIQPTEARERFQIYLKVIGSGSDKRVIVNGYQGSGASIVIAALAKNHSLSWDHVYQENRELWSAVGQHLIEYELMSAFEMVRSIHSWGKIDADQFGLSLSDSSWVYRLLNLDFFSRLPRSEKFEYSLTYNKKKSQMSAFGILGAEEDLDSGNTGLKFVFSRDLNDRLGLAFAGADTHPAIKQGPNDELIAIGLNDALDWNTSEKVYPDAWDQVAKSVLEFECFSEFFKLSPIFDGWQVFEGRDRFLTDLSDASWMDHLDWYAFLNVNQLRMGRELIFKSTLKGDQVNQLGIDVSRSSSWHYMADLTSQIRFRLYRESNGKYRAPIMFHKGHNSRLVFQAWQKAFGTDWRIALRDDGEETERIITSMIEDKLVQTDFVDDSHFESLSDIEWLMALDDHDVFDSFVKEGREFYFAVDLIRHSRDNEGYRIKLRPARDFNQVNSTFS